MHAAQPPAPAPAPTKAPVSLPSSVVVKRQEPPRPPRWRDRGDEEDAARLAVANEKLLKELQALTEKMERHMQKLRAAPEHGSPGSRAGEPFRNKDTRIKNVEQKMK